MQSNIFIVDEMSCFSFKYTNRFLLNKYIKNWLKRIISLWTDFF